mmetsp:Transcript_127159/g.359910  ORF Transcript_127159/g.359910 Transcript_127159/m.359910 type:complete len:209 (+) Transcript_127159:219-845(+)
MLLAPGLLVAGVHATGRGPRFQDRPQPRQDVRGHEELADFAHKLRGEAAVPAAQNPAEGRAALHVAVVLQETGEPRFRAREGVLAGQDPGGVWDRRVGAPREEVGGGLELRLVPRRVVPRLPRRAGRGDCRGLRARRRWVELDVDWRGRLAQEDQRRAPHHVARVDVGSAVQQQAQNAGVALRLCGVAQRVPTLGAEWLVLLCCRVTF